MRDTEYKLFFHKDSSYAYRFDETTLPNGAIYGMKAKRAGDTDRATKLTARNLTAIQSAADFEKHVHEVGEVVKKRRGRRMTPVELYTVELCVVLIREKVRKVSPPPASSIVCQSVGAALFIYCYSKT